MTDAQNVYPSLDAGGADVEVEVDARKAAEVVFMDLMTLSVDHATMADELHDQGRIAQALQAYGDKRAADAVQAERERLPQRVHPDSECTRDPIYLLQSKRWHCVKQDSYHWDGDGEAMFRTADDTEVDESYMRNSEDFAASWHVEGVWFTREEAERFGKSTYYRYEHGHRVYCVCADGELAKLLRAVTTREPTP